LGITFKPVTLQTSDPEIIPEKRILYLHSRKTYIIPPLIDKNIPMTPNRKPLLHTLRIGIAICLAILATSCDKKEPEAINDESQIVPAEEMGESVAAITIYDHHIWIGSSSTGLYHFNGSTWTRYTTEDGLVNDTITALASDSNGILWIGTKRGISRYEDQSWSSYTESEGLFHNDIRSITTDQDNHVWIGTVRNRVIHFNGSDFTEYHVNPVGEMGHIHTVCFDLDGNLWVGSCVSGLSKFNGTTWEDHINGLKVFVESSICTPVGDLWIGSFYGAHRYSLGTWTDFSTEDGLASNLVYSLAIDQQKNTWIGTDTGLSKYDGDTWETFTIHDGLPANFITALACDPDGTLWIGTNSGLAKMCLCSE
jgi:streptogramin lyase